MRAPKPLTKGLIARIRKRKIAGKLYFQFNPSVVTRQGTVDWQWGMGPGSIMPIATFGKVGPLTINLALLYDARENYDPKLEGLRAVLSEAESLGLPAVDRWSVSRNQRAVSPDRCRVVMGNRSWNCEVTSWNIQEMMWNRKLEPLRAIVTYQLRLSNQGIGELQSTINDLKDFRDRYAATNDATSEIPTVGGLPGAGIFAGAAPGDLFKNPYQ